jgi:hypothetical protein
MRQETPFSDCERSRMEAQKNPSIRQMFVN